MAQMQTMGSRRKLRVDLKGLQVAFDDSSFETHYFLDRRTGAVERVSGAIWRQLENIYEELNQAGDHTLGQFDSATRRHHLPLETQQALRQAHQIECSLGERYSPLPPAHPHTEVRDMEDYIITLQDQQLCDSLWGALRRHNGANHFLDVLSAYPELAEHWKTFRVEQIQRRIHIWLEEEGIEPIE